MVEENRAEVNFELVERLAEREQRDWTYFGRLRHEREKKLRDPQDVLIEADGLRPLLKKRRAQRRGTQQQKPAVRYEHFVRTMASMSLGNCSRPRRIADSNRRLGSSLPTSLATSSI
jgi:hypothetical protein